MSVELAKELVEQHAVLTARVSELSTVVSHSMTDQNRYRSHLRLYVTAEQGSHCAVKVQVTEDVVRAHFELALARAKERLAAVEKHLARLVEQSNPGTAGGIPL